MLGEGADVVVQSSAGDFASFRVAGLESHDTRRMGKTDFTFLRATVRS
jgi:hypothetical protein